MADPFDELRERLNRESAESDAKLHQFVREGITEEQLREDWRQLRGQGSRSGDPRSRLDLWREFLAAMWAAHIPQRLTAGVCAVAVLLMGWWLLIPSGIPLRTTKIWEVGGVRLPGELQLKGGSRLLLAGDTMRLQATLGEGKRGATDAVQAYQVHFEGRTRGGEKIQFNGTLVITNAPGATGIGNKRDILGAVLAGEWQVGNQVTNLVSPAFVP
jgi:hypothetical protein